MLLLTEWDGFTGLPDASGIRGKGVDRPLQKRASDYPYDKSVDYGNPRAYDRGSSASRGYGGPPTPKDTRHSVWDDIEEAIGTPSMFGKDAQAAGRSQGWAASPPKGWDHEDIGTLEPDEDHIPDSHAPPASHVQQDPIGLMSGMDAPSDIMIFGTRNPFKTGLGSTMSLSRHLGGLVPKESSWKKLSGVVFRDDFRLDGENRRTEAFLARSRR